MTDYTRIPRKLKRRWQARDNFLLVVGWIAFMVLFCWGIIEATKYYMELK